MINIGFFGTPELAKSVLASCFENTHFSIKYVVTQPDKPVWRHATLTPSPVKIYAEERGIPVFTPSSFRNNSEILEVLQKYPVDYAVVVAYGKILPNAILELPSKMAINVHGSILPKHRWASPIQNVLLSGEAKTGVTIMKMSEWMDEGDILRIHEILIDPNETAETLFQKFEICSGWVLTQTLIDDYNSPIVSIPQNHSEATYCKKISKDDGKIPWNDSAENIFHKYQWYTPWPGIWCLLDNKRLKLLHVQPGDILDTSHSPWEIFFHNTNVFLQTGSGVLECLEVQLEGKTRTPAYDFFRTRKGVTLT